MLIRGGSFWRELRQFCGELNLSMADLKVPTDSFTFLSGAHDTRRWIDHVIFSREELISSIEIRYRDNIFDHYPFFLRFKISRHIDSSNNE